MNSNNVTLEQITDICKNAALNYSVEKYDEAIEYYNEALSLAKKMNLHAETLLVEAFIKIVEKKFDEAISLIKNLVDEGNLILTGLAYDRLGLAYLEKKENDKAIEYCEKALADEGYSTPGFALNNIGVAHSNKKDYEKAIEYYLKALAEESFDTPGKAWSNMGNAYAFNKEYAEALVYYKKALAEESYDTPGIALFNMGITYSDLKDYDKAIEYYNKALAAKNFTRPWQAWNNIGSAYEDKMDYDKAIEGFQRAIADENNDELGICLFNMGLVYYKKKEYSESLNYLNESKNNPPFDNNVNKIKKVNSLIAIIKSKIIDPNITLSSNDEEYTKSVRGSTEIDERAVTPESIILNKIMDIDGDIASRHLSTPISDNDNFLIILKGWSSSTPFFIQREKQINYECRGGGYFLKWRGIGIVVDPGIDFIKNFTEAGFNFQEINLVIVSHNHTDHNQDLHPIDDIMYELAKRKEGIKYYLLTDEDTRNNVSFDPPDGKHRILLPKFDIERLQFGSEEEINLMTSYRLPIVIKYFKVEHSGCINAVGFRIDLYNEGLTQKECSIGMTCDTKYFDDLCKDSNLGNVDILIAHISQPLTKELTDPDFIREDHLGYRGTAKLISNCRSTINLVTEFWGGKGDLRIELIHGLRALCKNKSIFPGSIGCMIDLNQMYIQCTKCCTYTSQQDIIVVPPTISFGKLQYLCSNCRI